MNLLNRELNELIPFKKEFNIFLQEGGVGCYDVKKWAIFIPESFDTPTKIQAILHEGAHLILREKLESLDQVRW